MQTTRQTATPPEPPTTVTLGPGIFPVVLLASAGLLVPIVVIIAALVLLAILLRSA